MSSCCGLQIAAISCHSDSQAALQYQTACLDLASGGIPRRHPRKAFAVLLTSSFFFLQKIVTADYVIPESIPLSSECKDLIRRVFVVNPGMRINLDQIKTHPWFTRNLPLELQQVQKCAVLMNSADGSQIKMHP